METLSEKEFKKIWHGLLCIPTIDEREDAITLAQGIVDKYEAGLLSMTEKQYNSLKKGLVPLATELPQNRKLKNTQ